MTTPKNTCHFLAAALAIYERDGVQKQRHVNILIETESPQLTRNELGQIHHGVLARMQAENGIAPADMKDVVVLNISLLGVMPSHVFHGTEDASAPEAETQH